MVDPIEDFIDGQLRSLWVAPTEKHKIRSIAWWPYMHIVESHVRYNTHEDKLIAALDWKYHRGVTKRERIEDKLIDGYNQTEIALLTGISQQAVSKHLKKIRKRLKVYEPRRVTNERRNSQKERRRTEGV